ncbi:hypothetical protein ACFOOM_00805 [Streptomyces echinoruber]|nr:hypothetical protein [Streptomyces echinoruber]
MDDASDLDEWFARLPKPSPSEGLAELLAAREAAAAAPELSTIPMPEFPYPLSHPLGGTMRFSCALGCGWYHDENPIREEREPLVLPADPEKWRQALAVRAEVRGAAFRARVEGAIADHFAQAHPGR